MINIFSNIDVGTRPSQQDAIKMLTDSTQSLLDERGHLTVLCDGMGGMANGALASQMCTDLVVSTYYDEKNIIEDIPAFFDEIVKLADNEISKVGEMGLGVGSCGTTMVSACIKDDELYVCAVGDSMIYIVRNGKIKALNHEHNYELELKKKVEDGKITQMQADNDEKKYALISYIGMGGVKYIDKNTESIKLKDKDIVLLCSDGICGVLDENEILEIIVNSKATEIPRVLVDKVINNPIEDKDNMSAIVMEYLE